MGQASIVDIEVFIKSSLLDKATLPFSVSSIGKDMPVPKKSGLLITL
jgi:hypothetical protein